MRAEPARPDISRVGWLDEAMERLEANDSIDGLFDTMASVAAPFNAPATARLLRGGWLGHALHPLLTDFPLGCWIGALALDLMGGPSTDAASRKLVGMGLAAVPLTVAAGLAEWGTIDRTAERRVTTVHALGNTVAAAAFGASWLHRRRRNRRAGVVWGLIGGFVALGTGYLGGHLSFARGVGMGHRGRPSA